MTTFDELILKAEVELDQQVKAGERALAQVKYIHSRAEQEGRAALSEDESADVKAAMQAHKRAEEDKAGVLDKLANLKQARAIEEANDLALAERDANPGKAVAERPSYDRVARVGQEKRTYNPESDRVGKQFLRDVARGFMFQDVEANYRLQRHMQEERVERSQYLTRAAGDAVVSAFSGLVVPQYLTDMVAPAVAGLRPFADICNRHELPAAGMTFNISKITTPTSVALQGTELTAVSATSIDDTLLPISVQTAAGQQLMSRQAIERGTGTEDVTVQDLFRRYATTLDSTLLNQSSPATGLSSVAQAVTYTDTTPTAAELWPKVHNALANSEAALLAQATPTHVVMHSRRWYWMQSQVGTSWPFVAQPGIPTQAGATNFGVGYAQGARGVLPNGMPVVVDNNISTTLGGGTEDEIYVVAADECHLWEDANAPVFIRAEQPSAASLGVLLVLYGYFAYTHNRYTNGQSKISGSGLIAPTF